MTDDQMLQALAATVELTRRAERDLFGGLDADVRERPIREGDWNPKDFQAHLTAWKARQAERYAQVRQGIELPPPMDDHEEDAVNAELRATRIDWTWEAVTAEADEVAERLVSEIRRADAAVLRSHDRLLSGTFGNGVLHALTHFRWLLEAGVPMDAEGVRRFAADAQAAVSDPALPEKARAVGLYDLACFHALGGSADAARGLLRDAFRLDPELVAFSRTDSDLESISDEIDALAG